MTKCFLFDLSKYILIPILTEWLKGKDLLYLDYSQCFAEDKYYLLELIKLHPKPFQKSVFTGITIFQHSHPLFRWAEARGLTLGEVVLVMNELTLENFKSEIAFKDHSLKKKFACLKQISSLKISITLCVESKNLVSRLLQCFPNLEWIEVPDTRYLAAVSKYCPSIQQLHVKDVCWEYADVSIFRNCKNISKIVWSSGYDGYIKEFLPMRKFILSMTVHGCRLSSVRDFQQPVACKVLLNGMLYGYKHLTDIAVSPPTDLDLRVLLWYRGATLRKLKLNLCRGVEYPSLLDLHLTCPDLTDLCLSTSDDLKGELLGNVIAPLTKLTVFSTTAYITNMNPFLATVAYNSLHSLALKYSNANVKAFPAVSFNLPYVTELTLHYGELFVSMPHFSLCCEFPNLKSLSLITQVMNELFRICSTLPSSLIALHITYEPPYYWRKIEDINPLLSVLSDYNALCEVTLQIARHCQINPITVTCKFDFTLNVLEVIGE